MNERLLRAAKSSVLIDTLVRRNPLVYPRAIRDFARWESEPVGVLAEEIEARLAHTLSVSGTTRYGSQYRGLALEDWPILEKEALRSSPESFITRHGRPQAVGTTSGTTGKPLVLRRSISSVAFERAAIDRSLLKAGADPRGRYVILRGDNIKSPDDFDPPFWRFADAGRALVMSSNHICASTAQAYAEAIVDHAPEYMIAYPTSLEALAGHCRAQAMDLTVRVLLTQAEVLSPACRHLAGEVFSSHVVDEYGQAERVAKANSYAPGEYCFVPGYAHIELIPTPVPTIWQIIGTSLANSAMPLVRYRTGDTIEMSAPPSPDLLNQVRLGRAGFKRVIGRSEDYLLAPSGVRLLGIDHIPRGVSNILQSQIIQHATSVRILVVPASGYSAVDEAKLLGHARQKIPSSMSVEVEIVERLNRTSAGKAPFVIRKDLS